MPVEYRLKFIINILFAGIVTVLSIFVLKYLIWWLLPLLLGFCIAFVLRPVVNAVYRLSSATRRFCAAAVLLGAYAVLLALLWLGLVQLIAGMRTLFANLPTLYAQAIAPALSALTGHITAFLERFFPQLGAEFTSVSGLLATQLDSFVANASSAVMARATAFVAGIPTVMLTFLFTILSSFFISMDYDNVVSFAARLLPRRYRKTLFEVKDFLVHTAVQYGKAYLTLLGITFTQVWAGLALLRVDGSGWWALGIALADLLPAIGTGIILLPWAVLSLALERRFLGFGLLILYAVITLVRNILEPKIVGDNIGLPPLVTITSMFLGLKLLGVFGLFAAPFVVLIVKFLHDGGKIHLWDKKVR